MNGKSQQVITVFIASIFNLKLTTQLAYHFQNTAIYNFPVCQSKIMTISGWVE